MFLSRGRVELYASCGVGGEVLEARLHSHADYSKGTGMTAVLPGYGKALWYYSARLEAMEEAASLEATVADLVESTVVKLVHRPS